MRVENWDLALFRWLKKKLGKPFRWGRTDCASLVKGAAKAMYGRNVFGDVAPWSSLRTAKEALDAVDSIPAVLVSQGATRVRRAFTQSGDIAYTPGIDDDGLPRLAVVWSGKALVSTLGDGVRIVPLADLADDTEFWRLPNG